MRYEYIIGGVGLLAIVAGAVWYYSRASQAVVVDSNSVVSDGGDGGSADSTFGDVSASIVSSVAGWKSVGEASTWLPALNAAEQQYGLPADLLARMAYQESHFRDSIIRGTQASPAGALGILQLMPQYFQTVQVPTPFTDDDVKAQIDESAQQMQKLYGQFNDWSLALAAYNAGAGNVHKYGGIPPFTETQDYVSQITADVPSIGVPS